MNRGFFTLVAVFLEFYRLGGIDFVFFSNIVLLVADFAHQAE